ELIIIVEYISTSSRTVPAFIILPGINITKNYINNCLDRYNVFATLPNSYIDN
ncbi:hypothetical protein QBC45DRAFT_323957, partial [Copromyces sp. CBS 386.78]